MDDKGKGVEKREEEYEGGKVKERGREKCSVISCATEPHSRHGRNSR